MHVWRCLYSILIVDWHFNWMWNQIGSNFLSKVIAAKKSEDILISDSLCEILFSPSWKHLGFYPCVLKFYCDILRVFSVEHSVLQFGDILCSFTITVVWILGILQIDLIIFIIFFSCYFLILFYFSGLFSWFFKIYYPR